MPPSSSSSVVETLIPGLPDDIAGVILASIPLSHHPRLRSTSRSWHAFLSPRPLFALRRHLRLPSLDLLCLFPSDPSFSPPLLFDPSAPSAWATLPTVPSASHLYGRSNFVPLAAGRNLYLLGGSHFDAHSYPLFHPLPSATAHRLDLAGYPRWSRLPDMVSPRGSFACARSGPIILAAGGGSRNAVFPSDGTRMSSVEVFDVNRKEWRTVAPLPRDRAGCVGFIIHRGGGKEEEFWVMGGYGDYAPIAGVVPAHVYYRNAVVLGLRSGKWREVGDMWEAGEREKLGPVAVVDREDGEEPEVYMLDRNRIFRYNFPVNQWHIESTLRRRIPLYESCAFAAMSGELYVLTSSTPYSNPSGSWRRQKRRPAIEIQVYDPRNKKWRFVTTSPPFNCPIDFKTAVSCTIRL